MEDFKFSNRQRGLTVGSLEDKLAREQAQRHNEAMAKSQFANRVDPTDLLHIRDPEDISGLSVRGIGYLKGVQEEIMSRLNQPGGKSSADAYLARQMEKFTDLNGEDAAKVRTELYDYITAVTYFVEA